MKKIIYLLMFLFTVNGPSFAQEDQAGDVGTVRERMIEYIQQKLSLTKSEAERFGPVFIDYFRELRKTNHDYKSDRLVLQQKVAELRLRYREQFKPIIGEKRSNDVFTHEREFIQKAKEERDLRLQNHQQGRG